MLSPSAVQNAKPQATPYKMVDERGMYLLVRPDGARWWRFDYRRPGTGKRNTLSLGTFPDVSLKRAREKREEARQLLADGIDPGLKRQAEREAQADTFAAVATEWLAKQTWVPHYRSKVEAWFQNDILPWIGDRPIADITAPEFLRCARRMESRGAVESAHRMLQNCGQVMRYAVATGRADRNPVTDLRGALAAPVARHHAAVTDPDEIGALLRAIDAYHGSLPTKIALQLMPLVFVRPGELRHAEWSEFDFDAAEWNIPAHKMKMRQPHLVPLSRQALDLLRELQPLTGRSQYVFPGGRSPKRPMSNNALNAALRRMGFDKDTVTAHGFRATARTILDEVLGYRPDFIEHQLAHAVRDPNGRAYNRTSHLPERRKMMQGWADHLDALRTGGNVVAIRKAG